MEIYTKGGVNLENKLGADIKQNINSDLRHGDTDAESKAIASQAPIKAADTDTADVSKELSWEEFIRISSSDATPESGDEETGFPTDVDRVSTEDGIADWADESNDTQNDEDSEESVKADIEQDSLLLAKDGESEEAEEEDELIDDSADTANVESVDENAVEANGESVDENAVETNGESDSMNANEASGETEEPDTNEANEEELCPVEGSDEPCFTPPPPIKEERYDPEHPRKIDFIFDFLELFVFTLVAVLIVTTFFIRHSVVEGGSMMNTLQDGDTLIISDLFYEPECGDVIVIESTQLGKAIVKRVIAVGGQRVRVTPEGIYVGGEPLDEADYVYTDDEEYFYGLLYTDRKGLSDDPTFQYVPGSHYEFVVPDGEVFVMGDHRNDSTDSRALGTLHVDAILGKVLWRVLPFGSFGAIE